MLDRREVHSPKKFTWSGHIEGVQRSQVTLVAEDGVMVGNIRVADSFFQVRYAGADVHVVQQIDESRFPRDGEPIPVYLTDRETTQDFGITAADDGSTFNVIVVYPPSARAAADGTAAMNTLINLRCGDQYGIFEERSCSPSQTGPSGGSQIIWSRQTR